MRAQRAPLRPTFSSARLCHVVHVALLYFTEEWGPAEDPKYPSLNSTPGCLKVIDTFRPFPALSLQIFPRMLGPLPRWLTECAYPFLPLSHRPSPKPHRVGSSTAIRSTTSEREVFRGCSHLMIFRPPSLLPPRSFPPLGIRTGCSGRPWRLRPSTARFVTSPRIGYASRPNSGN